MGTGADDSRKVVEISIANPKIAGAGSAANPIRQRAKLDVINYLKTWTRLINFVIRMWASNSVLRIMINADNLTQSGHKHG